MRRLIFLAAFLPLVVLAYVAPGSPKGLVNDFAGVLDSVQKNALESQLQNFKETTGNEITVVTIKSLDGDTVENYANELFKKWGIGQKGKDNGVLFLAAIDDKMMRFEIGYGLEGVLTDAQTYWIQQNEIVPAFKNGDYAGGISAGIEKVIGAISGSEQIPSASPAEPKSKINSDFLVLLFFVPLWLASILGRSKSWWLGGVLGGIGGVAIGIFFGFLYLGFISIFGLTALGLIFDFFVSKAYQKGKASGHFPWWIGGGRGSGGGSHGGFGGFGGGLSGGGGSSSRW